MYIFSFQHFNGQAWAQTSAPPLIPETSRPETRSETEIAAGPKTENTTTTITTTTALWTRSIMWQSEAASTGTGTPATESMSVSVRGRGRGTAAGHDHPVRVASVWYTDRWDFGPTESSLKFVYNNHWLFFSCLLAVKFHMLLLSVWLINVTFFVNYIYFFVLDKEITMVLT